MILKSFLIFIWMSSLTRVGVTQDKDFCETYSANNFEVNFVMDQYTDRSAFLFIRQNYWKVIERRVTQNERKLVFTNTKSQFVTNWFGEGNRTAFEKFLNVTNESGNETKLFYGLLQKDKISWAQMGPTTDDTPGRAVVLTIDTVSDPLRTPIRLGVGFNPSIAIVFLEGTQVTFIAQKTANTDPVEYLRSIRRFSVKDVTRAEDITNLLIDWMKNDMQTRNMAFEDDDSIVTDVRSTRKLMAMSHHNTQLFQEGKTITYCFANSLVYFGRDSPDCSETQLLIDCNPSSNSTNTPTLSYEDYNPINGSTTLTYEDYDPPNGSSTLSYEDYDPSTTESSEENGTPGIQNPTQSESNEGNGIPLTIETKYPNMSPFSPDDSAEKDIRPTRGDNKADNEKDRSTPGSHKPNIWVVYVILAIVCMILGVLILISWFRGDKREAQKGSADGDPDPEPSKRSIG